MVAVKLASKLATASGESVCENDSGGNGTDPGAGATREGYGYVVGVSLFPNILSDDEPPLTAAAAA